MENLQKVNDEIKHRISDVNIPLNKQVKLSGFQHYSKMLHSFKACKLRKTLFSEGNKILF